MLCFMLLRSTPKPLEDQTKNIGCTFLSWCCLIYLRASLTASPACTPSKCSIKMKVGHRWNDNWQTALSRSPSWEANNYSASQEIHAFFGTRRFITAFTSTRQLSVSWTRSIQSLSPPPTSWTSILVLSNIYAKIFQVLSFPQISSPKPCMHLSRLPYAPHVLPISFCHTCHTPHPSHSSWFDHPNIIWWRVRIVKLLVV